jgi:hypothetical protein
MTDELTHGEVLVLAIVQAAGYSGRPISQFASPLSPTPAAWLAQLRRAQNPTAATRARIAALLAGEPVPPPPPNNFQASPRKPAANAVRRAVQPAVFAEPINREPCWRCGVRGDIGCEHMRSAA